MSNPTRPLSAIETLALAKVLTGTITDNARNQIGHGNYTVSLDLHAEVEMVVGQDYESLIVSKAKPYSLLAAAIEEYNLLAAAVGRVGMNIEKLVEAAERIDPGLVEHAEAQTAAAVARIKGTTLTRCRGRVTVPSRRVVVYSHPVGKGVI